MGDSAGDPDRRESLDGAPDGRPLKLEVFEELVRQLADELPASYLDGVLAIDVSRRTVPHPARPDVFTLGECIHVEGEADDLSSRIVLYHGSFRAVAAQSDEWDWRGEAWETLTHELRHHLEWRARAGDLEDYDWAAEQNFARQAGEAFDILFHRAGERVADRAFQVGDDLFFDMPVRRLPREATFAWRGHRWRVPVPAGSLPLLLSVDGVRVPPPGDIVLVFRRPPGLRSLLQRSTVPRAARAVARRAEAD